MMKISIDNVTNRLVMPECAKSVVVDLDPKRQVLVEELLCQMGYSTAIRCRNIQELYGVDWSRSTDARHVLVLCTTEVSDALLTQLRDFLAKHRLPTVMMTEDSAAHSIKKATDAGVNSYVVVGVQGNRIKTAIDSALANFDLVEQLKINVDSLQRKLSDRILIEKAKGIVAKGKSLTEDQAFIYLRQYSMEKGIKIVEVAKMIIATTEILEK